MTYSFKYKDKAYTYTPENEMHKICLIREGSPVPLPDSHPSVLAVLAFAKESSAR